LMPVDEQRIRTVGGHAVFPSAFCWQLRCAQLPSLFFWLATTG
jgi:hypothetical protein